MARQRKEGEARTFRIRKELCDKLDEYSEKTMLSKVNDQFTADYLWNEKQIVSFLKVDKGLAEQANGVKLMKEIPELDEELKEANEKNVFGTKMRSVIYEPNEEGIKAIVL